MRGAPWYEYVLLAVVGVIAVLIVLLIAGIAVVI